MKKAIITGANGFIGQALTQELSRNKIKVYAIIRNSQSDITKIENLSNVTIIYCDLQHISDIEEIISDRDIDVFFHLAWEGSSGSARTDSVLQLKNVQWAIDCVNLAKRMNCKKIVCTGSICEKESIASINIQGDYLPLSYIYGSAKLTAHCMCSAVAGNIGIPLLWPIITNAYGIGEYSPRFINSTIRKMLNKEQLSFTKATQNYDFVYISDIARALFLIGAKGKPFHEYLIGSSHPRPLKDYINIMGSIINPNQKLKFGDIVFLGKSLPIETYDCSQIKKDTGFEASIPFAEGIKMTAEWMKKYY